MTRRWVVEWDGMERIVEDIEPEYAAAEAVEMMDCENEYLVANDKQVATVRVRPEDSDEPWVEFVVRGEWNPTYYAERATAERGGAG